MKRVIRKREKKLLALEKKKMKKARMDGSLLLVTKRKENKWSFSHGKTFADL
jgi:hypothetical protein